MLGVMMASPPTCARNNVMSSTVSLRLTPSADPSKEKYSGIFLMKSKGEGRRSMLTLGSSRMRIRAVGNDDTCERPRKLKLYSLWFLLMKTCDVSSGEIAC